MITSRIIEHAKQQHWTTVFLEFLMVVLGVFLGIQVSNWNEARADKHLGMQYVERLTRDVRKDLAGNREVVSYYAAVLDSVERADKLLSDPDASPREVVVQAYRASEINRVAQTRATWDQIVSAGHLGLLPDALIDSGLSDYFAFDTGLGTYKDVRESAYRHAVRKIIPIGVQKALRAGCSDERDEAQTIVGFMKDCRLDVDPAELGRIAAELRDDPSVAANLRYQYSDVVSANLNLSGDVVLLERALKVLEETAGKLEEAK
jgi:ABC-type multidrug transport system fused ATPase/permease subunit